MPLSKIYCTKHLVCSIGSTEAHYWKVAAGAIQGDNQQGGGGVMNGDSHGSSSPEVDRIWTSLNSRIITQPVDKYHWKSKKIDHIHFTMNVYIYIYIHFTFKMMNSKMGTSPEQVTQSSSYLSVSRRSSCAQASPRWMSSPDQWLWRLQGGSGKTIWILFIMNV